MSNLWPGRQPLWRALAQARYLEQRVAELERQVDDWRRARPALAAVKAELEQALLTGWQGRDAELYDVTQRLQSIVADRKQPDRDGRLTRALAALELALR